MVDELKKVYPDKKANAKLKNSPASSIMYSTSIRSLFLIAQYALFIKIAKNGTKYNINPNHPKIK